MTNANVYKEGHCKILVTHEFFNPIQENVQKLLNRNLKKIIIKGLVLTPGNIDLKRRNSNFNMEAKD